MKIKTKILKPKAVLFKTFILKETTKELLFIYRKYQYYPLPKTRISHLKKESNKALCFPNDIAIYDDRCLIIQVAKNLFLSYSYSPTFNFNLENAKQANKCLAKTAKSLLDQNNGHCEVYGQIIEFNLVIK